MEGGLVNRGAPAAVSCLTTYWLVDIDRDYKTEEYGTGPRLYHELSKGKLSYVIVLNTKTAGHDGNIIVTASDGCMYVLTTEPDIELWKDTCYAHWKTWDASTDWTVHGNRSDYEPLAFKTRKAFISPDRPDTDAFYRDTPWD